MVVFLYLYTMWLAKLFGQVKNFDSDIVTNKVKEERLSICNTCPHKRADFKTLLVKKKGVAQCGVCKCSILEKAIWESEECPKNMWNV